MDRYSRSFAAAAFMTLLCGVSAAAGEEVTQQIVVLGENNGQQETGQAGLSQDEMSQEMLAGLFDGPAQYTMGDTYSYGMSLEEIRAEISRCTGQIIALTGRAPRFFRPPYIDVSRTLYDEVGLGFICGAGCKDWLPETSVEERVRLTLENARDGEIILLHDSLGNVNTVEALREIIPALKEQDYSFVTCGQLFDECGVVPKKGWLYSNVYQKGADDRL